MPKTNAERQREFRARRQAANEGMGDRRLNIWIRSQADLALERLARRYAVTKREMIERLAEEADRAEWEGLDPYGAEWAEYFGED